MGGDIAGKRVAIVEDGPTLTHGGMTYGAGVVAARRFGAAEIVDPRPYAAGELARTLAKYPNLENLLPAMGYGREQMDELQAALNAMPADLVLAANPIDLTRVLPPREAGRPRPLRPRGAPPGAGGSDARRPPRPDRRPGP